MQVLFSLVSPEGISVVCTMEVKFEFVVPLDWWKMDFRWESIDWLWKVSSVNFLWVLLNFRIIKTSGSNSAKV